MQKKARISEINLSTRLVNGSEAAYKYTIEGVRMAKVTKCLWMVEQIGKWDF